jgi:hypothetical protein
LNNHKIMKMCDPTPPPLIPLNLFNGVLRSHYENDDLNAAVCEESEETRL